MNNDLLLQVVDLKKYFPVNKGPFFGNDKKWIKAVDGVSLELKGKVTLGLVGESGCGKTTIAGLLLLLEKPTSGKIMFAGKDAGKFRNEELKQYRRSVQAVFQDPSSCLSPRMRIRDIVAEPMEATGALPRNLIETRIQQLLEMVELPAGHARRFPHELSGGERQRVAIARALGPNPRVVILDEAVSALDVSIRAQIVNLLQELQAKTGVSYIFIGHDLSVVAHMSDQIAVMYLGKVMELCCSEELCVHPLHPYTQALLSAALPAHPDDPRGRAILRGEPSNPLDLPAGCRFHPRCGGVTALCSKSEPPLTKVEASHAVACWKFADPALATEGLAGGKVAT